MTDKTTCGNCPHEKHLGMVCRAFSGFDLECDCFTPAQTADSGEDEWTEAEMLADHCRRNNITHHSIDADGNCNMGCC